MRKLLTTAAVLRLATLAAAVLVATAAFAQAEPPPPPPEMLGLWCGTETGLRRTGKDCRDSDERAEILPNGYYGHEVQCRFIKSTVIRSKLNTRPIYIAVSRCGVDGDVYRERLTMFVDQTGRLILNQEELK